MTFKAAQAAGSTPIPLLVAVRPGTFTTLVLIHLQAALFLQVAHES
tara:strand:- start:388 stop:525 length:138 start_codon:yes stop_codon:yes gene_type:complete